MQKLTVIILSSIVFLMTGCADKMLLSCKTPDVKKASIGNDELEYLNNKFIEAEQLRLANEVCK